MAVRLLAADGRPCSGRQVKRDATAIEQGTEKPERLVKPLDLNGREGLGREMAMLWYNGRGNASTNINALVPTIALERIEVVKDGASALYGSDAVAGVVNFITKNDFEGFDVTYQFTTDEQTNQGDTGLVSAIWGVQGVKLWAVQGVKLLAV